MSFAKPSPYSQHDASIYIDRRTQSRRAADLDGAYNDDAQPTPIGKFRMWALYGVAAWIATAAIIGSVKILYAAWGLFA